MTVIQSILLGVAAGASVVSIVLLLSIYVDVIEISKKLNKEK